MSKKAARAPVMVLMTILMAVSLSLCEETEYVKKWRAGLAERLPENIAKLRAELAEGNVSEFTVRDVAFSKDPRAVNVLLELLSSPEVIRHPHGLAKYSFVLAATGLGEIGDSRAVAPLKQFLESRLSTDTLDDEALPFGGNGVSGRTVNYWRRSEAMHAALALYALGDWRPAIKALDELVQREYVEGEAPVHLYKAVRLSLEPYQQDDSATIAIVGYLRRACQSPTLRVRAEAALQLADIDPDLAYQTAAEVIAAGPDENPLVPTSLAHHKRISVSVLAALNDPRARELLLNLSQTGGHLIREAAQQAISQLEGRRP